MTEKTEHANDNESVEATKNTADDLALVGSMFAGIYKIDALIASGGNGTLYRATHTVLMRRCALKLLSGDAHSGAKQIKSFQREARTISKLNHPNIIQVSAFGVENNRPFIVMDFVEGKSLAELLKRQGALSCEHATEILKQILAALSYAHANGIIHRDLKPGNIMIHKDADNAETVKLVDFGLAKSGGHAVGETVTISSTTSGSIAGSPAYMSPEQCRGEKQDERSDLYSVACLMYELISGVPPHQGSTTYETMQKHLDCEPMSPSQISGKKIPAVLESTIMKALSKDRNERFQSAERWYQALDGEPLPLQQPAKRTSKNLLIASLVSIVLIAGLAALSIDLFKKRAAPSVPLSQKQDRSIAASLSRIRDYKALSRRIDDILIAVERYENPAKQAAPYAELEAFISHWLEANKRNDTEGEIRYRYYEVLWHKGKKKEALKVLLPLLDEAKRTGVTTRYYDMNCTAASCALELRDTKCAQEILEKCISQKNDQSIDVVCRTVNPRIEYASVFFQRKEYEKALNYALETEKILERDLAQPYKALINGTLRTRAQISVILFAMGRFSEAAEASRRQVELMDEFSNTSYIDYPDKNRLHQINHLICLYVRANRLKEALDWSKKLEKEREKLSNSDNSASSFDWDFYLLAPLLARAVQDAKAGSPSAVESGRAVIASLSKPGMAARTKGDEAKLSVVDLYMNLPKCPQQVRSEIEKLLEL